MLNCASSLPSIDSADRLTLARSLLRRAVRHVVLLRAASVSLAHAPTLDDRIGVVERVRENLLQFEQAAFVYSDLIDSDLLTDAERLVAQLTFPSTWLEATIAQLLLCLATRVEVDAQPQLLAPLGASARNALACETEHLHAARAALRELDGTTGAVRDLANRLIMRWQRVALGTLEEETVRARYLHMLAQELAPIGMEVSA